MVVADEAHYLKNAQAKRSTAITPVVKAAERAILLTVTPLFLFWTNGSNSKPMAPMPG